MPDRVSAWWSRTRWSWRTARDTGITRYQVNGRGDRRVVQRPGGYQPIDRRWLATGEWSEPVPPCAYRSPAPIEHRPAFILRRVGVSCEQAARGVALANACGFRLEDIGGDR